MLVRAAASADLPGILAIYNEVIENSTAVYALDPVTLDERRTWFEERQSLGYPVVVAGDQADVLGFASFGPWRGAWPGYRYTVEHSVHVRAGRRGSGIGRALSRRSSRWRWKRASMRWSAAWTPTTQLHCASTSASVSCRSRTSRRWATSSDAGSISYSCSAFSMLLARLEHDPAKWNHFAGKDHAIQRQPEQDQFNLNRSCSRA
jgi:GNAT superfamily N-acetyltransferase